MRCPHCDSYVHTLVIDSRPVDNIKKRRRRYDCSNCGQRFSTVEIYDSELKKLYNEQNAVDLDTHRENKNLRHVVDWLLNCIYIGSENVKVLEIRKLVANPSQEMKERLSTLKIKHGNS